MHRCLEDKCENPEAKCHRHKENTIFHCPRGKWTDPNEMISFEEWVVEDVTATAFGEPLELGEEVFPLFAHI